MVRRDCISLKEFVLENNLDPAKKQRREHLKQDLQDWISQQPELRVRLNEFREKVGRQSDFQSITSGRDFRIENDAAAEKWVYVGAARNHHPQSGQSKNQRRVQLRQLILNWLEKLPEQMATRQDLIREFGKETNQVLNDSSLVQFDYQDNHWCQTEKYYSSVFKAKLAEYRKKRLDAAWEKCANLCGDVARHGSSKAKSGRLFVVARTYTIESAAKRLGFTSTLIRDAVSCKYIESFIDPDGKIRIPATAAEQAANNAGTLEKIEGLTLLKCRQISLVAGFSYSTARSWLLKAHISPTAPKWYQIKGLWGLPQSLKEFQKILAERYPAWLASVINERNTYAPAMPSYEPRHEREHEYSGKDIVEQGIALARKEAELLRQQLIDIFPTWDHTRNADPRVTLHIGPTNSGKTFTGLSSLESAGSGWYLSPLRLLAHEVFETLNARGVRCNLLTGEERIDVEGALITASRVSRSCFM